jgi:hypothetical protein
MINLLAAATANTGERVKEYEFMINENSRNEMFYNYSLFLYSIGEF